MDHHKMSSSRKSMVLCIISTGDNVFGGYTKTGWNNTPYRQTNNLKDEKAFIFSIRSSKNYPAAIFNTTASCDGNLQCGGYYSGVFGNNFAIWIGDKLCGSYPCKSFEDPPFQDYLLGGRTFVYTGVRIQDVEVFQLTQ